MKHWFPSRFRMKRRHFGTVKDSYSLIESNVLEATGTGSYLNIKI